MTKAKTTKSALLMSVLSMLLCVSMLVGSTFAWFTDSVTSGGNKIVAGNLDVELYHGTGTTDDDKVDKDTKLFTDKDGEPIVWEPGVVAYENFTVKNVGTLALKYELELIDLVKSTVIVDEEEKSLLDVLQFAVMDTHFTGDRAAATAQTVAYGSYNEFAGKTGELFTKNSSDAFAILIYWKSSEVDNDYNLNNGKTAIDENGVVTDKLYIEFGVHLSATQTPYEFDSFDEKYDENAGADVVVGKEIIDSLNDPNVSEVLVGGNIDLGSEDFLQPNGNVGIVIPNEKTLDLNNNTIIRPEGASGNGLEFQPNTTATVKNGTVYSEDDMGLAFINEGATVNFEGMHFEGHGSKGITVRAQNGVKTTVIFRNCTFNNAPVTLTGSSGNGATEIDVQFVGCEFSGTYKMYDEQGNALGGNVWPYSTDYLIKAADRWLCGNIKIENCTFDFDASEYNWSAVDMITLCGCDQNAYPGQMLNVLLKDITITGKKIRPVKVDSRYKNGVNITEEGKNHYTVDGQNVNPITYG